MNHDPDSRIEFMFDVKPAQGLGNLLIALLAQPDRIKLDKPLLERKNGVSYTTHNEDNENNDEILFSQ